MSDETCKTGDDAWPMRSPAAETRHRVSFELPVDLVARLREELPKPLPPGVDEETALGDLLAKALDLYVTRGEEEP